MKYRTQSIVSFFSLKNRISLVFTPDFRMVPSLLVTSEIITSSSITYRFAYQRTDNRILCVDSPLSNADIYPQNLRIILQFSKVHLLIILYLMKGFYRITPSFCVISQQNLRIIQNLQSQAQNIRIILNLLVIPPSNPLPFLPRILTSPKNEKIQSDAIHTSGTKSVQFPFKVSV